MQGWPPSRWRCQDSRGPNYTRQIRPWGSRRPPLGYGSTGGPLVDALTSNYAFRRSLLAVTVEAVDPRLVVRVGPAGPQAVPGPAAPRPPPG